jgi:hypothetical protein
MKHCPPRRRRFPFVRLCVTPEKTSGPLHREPEVVGRGDLINAAAGRGLRSARAMDAVASPRGRTQRLRRLCRRIVKSSTRGVSGTRRETSPGADRVPWAIAPTSSDGKQTRGSIQLFLKSIILRRLSVLTLASFTWLPR